MNELFNIIKNSLRTNEFYVPSLNSTVNGCSLTIKQYNDLLELDATVDFGFEQFLKYSILTDSIIKQNVNDFEKIINFDKPFLLAQIKMAQESNFLGYSLSEYRDNLKEKVQAINFADYVSEYSGNNLEIKFGLNSFIDTQQVNTDYLAVINDNYNTVGNVITLEFFKHLKSISFQNQSLGTLKNVKELKPLVEQLPANVVEHFNNLLQKVSEDTEKLNTAVIKEENFVFNPSLEFMLS